MFTKDEKGVWTSLFIELSDFLQKWFIVILADIVVVEIFHETFLTFLLVNGWVILCAVQWGVTSTVWSFSCQGWSSFVGFAILWKWVIIDLSWTFNFIPQYLALVSHLVPSEDWRLGLSWSHLLAPPSLEQLLSWKRLFISSGANTIFGSTFQKCLFLISWLFSQILLLFLTSFGIPSL